jgi:hypothetical protein
MISGSLIGLVVVGIVAAAFLVFAIRPQRKLPAEKELILLYTERCSATTRIGLGFRFGTNLPTGRLTLYEHGMVIAVATPMWIRYEDIEQVKSVRSLLSRRIDISARDPKVEASFNVRSPDRIAGILKAKGVRVVER